MENCTTGEKERLVERLERHNIQFRGEYHDYEVRWNQSLPTISELDRQYRDEKILYAWEEKSAYEARGPINGVQVATGEDYWTDGEKIKRIQFAYDGTFEGWRPTFPWGKARTIDGNTYLGEGSVEQEQFLLEEGERVTQVTTYTHGGNLCGLELSTTSGQHRFWGNKSKESPWGRQASVI